MVQAIDVSGLSAEQVQAVEAIVNGYRKQNETQSNGPPLEETAEEWFRRLVAWTESHPKREIEIDDSRETIYAGRGE